eukprot:350556-Chlamydomonas_euryale.AAC.14
MPVCQGEASMRQPGPWQQRAACGGARKISSMPQLPPDIRRAASPTGYAWPFKDNTCSWPRVYHYPDQH